MRNWVLTLCKDGKRYYYAVAGLEPWVRDIKRATIYKDQSEPAYNLEHSYFPKGTTLIGFN